MEKENLEFLQERLYFLGFGERLNKALEDKMKTGEKDFKLAIDGKVTSMGVDKKVDYVLDFAKSSKQDRYFLNSYTVRLKNQDKVEASQKIFLNYGAGLSSRESFNLLEGRSAHKNFKNKEGEPYETWVKIDFTKKDDYGNNKMQMYSKGWKYDLSNQLHKLPLKELQDTGQKENLMRNLKKGDLVEVNFVINKQDVKRHIAANPEGRNILVYDEKFVLLNKPKEEKKVQETKPERSGGIVFNDTPRDAAKDSSKDQAKEKNQEKVLTPEDNATNRSKKSGRGV